MQVPLLALHTYHLVAKCNLTVGVVRGLTGPTHRLPRGTSSGYRVQ